MKRFKYVPLYIAIVMFAVAGIGLVSSAPWAHATSAIRFVSTNDLLPTTSKNFHSNFATSTPIYMTAGTATTSLVMYTPDIDQLGVNVLFNASSTASVLQWRVEYSNDFLNWYADDTSLSTSTTASPGNSQYSWTYASSTAGTSQPSYNTKHFNVFNIAANYTRIVFYLASGSTPGAIVVNTAMKQTSVN